jgi:regulatory protein
MDKHKSKQTETKPEKRRPKIPKKITETYLHNAGLYYLQRFAASKAQFTEIMLRKVKKSCLHHKEQEESVCRKMVETLADKFEQSGLLNDDLYAQGQIASLRRRGFSRRAILQKLRQKGLKSEKINEKLDWHEAETENTPSEDGDLNAALTLARRKKIGPFQGEKKTDPKKAMAALARAGFSYQIARQVLDIQEDDMG